MSNQYPERIPDAAGKIDKFTFTLRNVDSAENDLDLQAEAYESRISKIVDHATINDIKIVGSILGLTHDEDELLMLGKALMRVAPLIKAFDEINQKRELLKLAKNNPSWVAWAFGDFEADLNELDSADFRLE